MHRTAFLRCAALRIVTGPSHPLEAAHITDVYRFVFDSAHAVKFYDRNDGHGLAPKHCFDDFLTIPRVLQFFLEGLGQGISEAVDDIYAQPRTQRDKAILGFDELLRDDRQNVFSNPRLDVLGNHLPRVLFYLPRNRLFPSMMDGSASFTSFVA
jgi:hypothetical protein